MIIKHPVLTVTIIAVIVSAAGFVGAETFCPEGGERFTGSEKFCPNHGVALKQVEGTEDPEPVDPTISRLRSHLEKYPGNRQAWVDLGNRCFDLGKPHDAIEAYIKALELYPDDVAVLNDLGVMYRKAGDFDQATITISKALALDPENRNALYNLGIIYRYDLKDYPKAITAWSKLLQFHPESQNGEWIRSEIAVMKKESGT